MLERSCNVPENILTYSKPPQLITLQDCSVISCFEDGKNVDMQRSQECRNKTENYTAVLKRWENEFVLVHIFFV